jgi:hypothetical protein
MSKKKSEFVVGDKVIFKKPVKVFPDRFSSDSVDFAKKGDKGTVVKTDTATKKLHSQITRIVSVSVSKQKHPVHLMDSMGSLFVDTTIEKI